MSILRCIWIAVLNIISLVSAVWIFVKISAWIPFYGWTVVAIIAMIVLIVFFIVTVIWVLRCTSDQSVDNEPKGPVGPSPTEDGGPYVSPQ